MERTERCLAFFDKMVCLNFLVATCQVPQSDQVCVYIVFCVSTTLPLSLVVPSFVPLINL